MAHEINSRRVKYAGIQTRITLESYGRHGQPVWNQSKMRTRRPAVAETGSIDLDRDLTVLRAEFPINFRRGNVKDTRSRLQFHGYVFVCSAACTGNARSELF